MEQKVVYVWSLFSHREAWLAVSICADVGRQPLKSAKPHTPGFSSVSHTVESQGLINNNWTY